MFAQNENINWPLLGISVFLLGGCAGDYIATEGPEYREYIESHLPQEAIDTKKAQEMSLDLDDAIRMGLERNLDLRLAALETLAASDNLNLTRLEAFPTVQAKANYIGRSDEGASSSRSVITGSQSLEPSISTDQHRRTMELETSWNLLDVAVTVLRSKTAADQARIAAERQRKIAQDLMRDITIAYHRAWVAQHHLDQISALRKSGQAHLDNLDTALNERLISGDMAIRRQEEMMERIEQFTSRERDLAAADIELKTLLNLPPASELRLTDKIELADPVKALPVKDDIESLEEYALLNRPEIKEQILGQNIALRERRLEVLNTFPGAEFLLTFHYDSNQFLQDDRWASVTGSLVQSITKLLTLPQRYQASKTQEYIAEEQTQSVIAAVLAQVNISKRLVDLEAQNYRLVKDRNAAALRKSQIARIKSEDGLGTRADTLIAAMDAVLVQTEEDLAYVDLQSAYARLLHTLGHTYYMRSEHTS